MSKLDSTELMPEISFSASRSGGPGGQHVNKVNTKVTLRLDIAHSTILTANQKAILLEKLASKISGSGELVLSASNHRSQLKNKQAVLKKLDMLLNKAFEKRRKATKPSAASVQKRLTSKKLHSEKKKWRSRNSSLS